MRTGFSGLRWWILGIFPSFSTDDQAAAQFEAAKSLDSSSPLARFSQQLSKKLTRVYNKEEGPWKVQKLNQPKQ
jgi:hypothetical protein